MWLLLFAPLQVQAKSPMPNELKVVMAKFITVMIGVAVASFLLFIIGLLFKRFFEPHYFKNEEMRRNSLNSPRDKDEAVMNFIMKNRLK